MIKKLKGEYKSMTISHYVKKLPTIKTICSFVIMAFFFSLPFSTSVSNILAVIVAVLWVLDRDYSAKIEEIKRNKVALAVLVYFVLHIVGLLWTEDMGQGLGILKKQWKLLLVPIFMNMALKKYTRCYIFCFLASMTLSMGVSYLVWSGLVQVKGAIPQDPTPFISHVVYGPFMAFAVYIALHEVLFIKAGKFKKIILTLIISGMTVNCLITQGRTGHLVFLLLVGVLTFQYLKKRYLKAACVSCLVLFTVLSVGYFLVPNFKARVNMSYHEFRSPIIVGAKAKAVKGNPNQRLIYWRNTMKLFYDNPIIGVGTGDFTQEYRSLIASYNYEPSKHEYYSRLTDNPHNQYLRTLSQFGIVGLIVLLSIFYFQTKSVETLPGKHRNILLAFPFFYLVIFIGESYLQINTTALFFSGFSGVLYKDSC